MAGQDLIVSVGANIQQLERQLKASARLAEEAADDIEAKFRKANPTLGGDFGLGALKGAIAAFSIDRIIKSFADANAEIASFGETSRRVGVDLQRFQELRLAAQSKGVAGKEFDAGIEGLAKKLNEARTEETELSRLFEANNLKLKSRTGEVINTNTALSVAADLISRAATEMDKVEIAEKFGLPKDFIPLLERGAGALNDLAREAGQAGSVLDSDVIAKAKQFDDAWNSAWASFASNSKAAIIGAAQGLSGLLSQVGTYLEKVDEANRKNSQSADRAAMRDRARDMALGNSGGRDVIDQARTAAAREARALFVASEKDRSVTTALPPSRPTRNYMGSDVTRNPGKPSGGGSGGGKSEEEQRTEQVQRYIEALERTNRVLAAEEATLGRSKAERAAAIELARIGTVTDEAQKQKIIEIVGANERYRESIERTKQAQKDLNEAGKYFGSAAVDALEDLVINGGRAGDVMKRLIASLAKAAIQAALLGEGPLAGIFGTKGVGGSLGGLFGLFGGGVKAASGGYISGPGTGRSDSISARLSNGEYVINARATKQNRALLDAINSGKIPRFADGGLVGRVPTIPAASRTQGGMRVVVNNTVSDQVQATPQQNRDGSMQIIIEAIKGDIANDLVTGRGAISQAFGAVRSGRQLRG
ncbi:MULTISPECIES: hypothetical protein [unclassified Bosea (in: a-proteobacteria)]|uniref:hypothetical protein n=1 Tax=unclassified Bosea (in: a-proteobacteria) TaxID=2653178 RepID=UPI000F75BC88|nr:MULTISPECIES: hypothetical protein [unclassified Bosea (in: a-proteobacteria)]AZO77474.1 hypothetical protein BLM15_07510 [Bosea sp. Tri-49]RXT18079.1 hypothetical protein B5U98_22660 [Bosea sp. Tri-39]RXT32677.1 hypothetical protein B5U99_29005 [Bosea sp. Tri-54]